MAKKEKPALSPEAQAAEDLAAKDRAEVYSDYDQFVQGRAAEIWQFKESGHLLNIEEQLFVRSYVIDRNPVAALRRLGHSTDDPAKLKARAQRYLARPEVVDAVDHYAKEMMDRLDVTAERVQRRIAAVAFFDVREVMSFDHMGATVLNSRYWTEDQAAAVQSIKMGQHGIEIKMYDGLKAAEMLSKQLGLQPEENDAAEAARIGAQSAMEKIGQIFDRMIPNDPEPEVLPPERRLN